MIDRLRLALAGATGFREFCDAACENRRECTGTSRGDLAMAPRGTAHRSRSHDGCASRGTYLTGEAGKSRGRQSRRLDLRQSNSVRAERRPVEISTYIRRRPAQARRPRRFDLRAFRGGDVSARRQHAHPSEGAGKRRARRSFSADSFRGRRHCRGKIVHSGSTRYRDLRRQGLPAASRDLAHGAGSSHAATRDRGTHSARTEWTRDVVAQSLSQRRRPRTCGDPLPNFEIVCGRNSLRR